MPVCLHCSRKFLNKEALHQHIKSSSLEHPFCTLCNRRFISQAACDAHMAAKHPPSFPCTTCNKSFPVSFALEDHYRGSAAHPNCSKCGRGFKDVTECDEHHRIAHPRVICHPCGGMTIYEDVLEDHYLHSSSHPTCSQCSRGFKDNTSYAKHQILDHPKLQCDLCERPFETVEALQNHYFASENHPECTLCHRGFKDDVEYRNHMEVHPLLSKTEQKSPVGVRASDYQLLSPIGSFPKYKEVTRAESSRGNAFPSPTLSLQTSYASPIMDVQTPFFSPICLPPPGKVVEEAWAARRNVQAPITNWSTGRSELVKASRPITSPPVIGITTAANATAADNNQMDYPSTYYTSSRQSYSPHSHADNSSSPASRSLEVNKWDTREVETTFNSPTVFHDVVTTRPVQTENWRSRSSRPVVGSRPLFDAVRRPPTSWKHSSVYRTGSINPQTRLLGPIVKTPLKPLAPQGPEGSHVNWQEIMDNKERLKANISESSLSGDDASTQAVDTPLHKFSGLKGSPFSGEVDSLSSNNSSLQTSSFSPWNSQTDQMSPSVSLSPKEQGPCLPSYKIESPTNESASRSSRSPEVFSPFGLAPLPTVSPLASTPVDVPFTQPKFSDNTQVPISPISNSPTTSFYLALDTKLPESPSVASLTFSQLEKTNTTSPQGSSLGNPFDLDILALKLPDSPVSEHSTTSPDEPFSSKLDIESDASEFTDGIISEFERTIKPSNEDTDDTLIQEESPTPPATLPPAPQRMHCRICRSEPCEDLTATMCGHIFCYKCITEEVIKASRCPVCQTPTLLYCLFRVDLTV